MLTGPRPAPHSCRLPSGTKRSSDRGPGPGRFRSDSLSNAIPPPTAAPFSASCPLPPSVYRSSAPSPSWCRSAEDGRIGASSPPDAPNPVPQVRPNPVRWTGGGSQVLTPQALVPGRPHFAPAFRTEGRCGLPPFAMLVGPPSPGQRGRGLPASYSSHCR